MERRNFLIGIGGSAVGGSALIGSGAFDRIESDRGISVAVSEDPDAYLGLGPCDSPHGDEYVRLDENGHLRVDIGANSADGEGVNTNSRTWFDDVFQLCNQSTDSACVWIEDDEEWLSEDGERRIEFYVDGDRNTSIMGKENGIALGTGECTCIGIGVRTHALSADDALLEDVGDRITVRADADGDCFEEPPTCVECAPGGDAERLSRLAIENTGSEKSIEVRQRRKSETAETIFGPETVGAGETFDFDLLPNEPPILTFYVDGQRIALGHADDNPVTGSGRTD